MCLLLGPPGAGKTLLLKRLNSCSNRGNYIDICEPPSTVSTVGTNLVNVLTTRKQEMTVRELGGCMAPIWHNYFTDCQALIFMVDISNRAQLAASCIQFLDILTNKHLQHIPILLLLNKVDMPNAMKRVEFDAIMRLPDIVKNAQQKIHIHEVSSREGQGLHEVATWLQEHVPVNS